MSTYASTGLLIQEGGYEYPSFKAEVVLIGLMGKVFCVSEVDTQ